MASKAQGSKDVPDRYASMGTRAHWKPEDAARVLDEWSRSGLSMIEFARERGLRHDRLQRWQARLGESSAQAVRLVPVTPRKAPLVELGSTSRSAAVVIAVGESARVEVTAPSEVDPRWVAALVHGLQGGLA